MSLEQEILQLESALRREKVSPEILMYEDELITKVVTRIEEKHDALTSENAENIEQQYDRIIQQLDLDRVKYLLSNYLRTRLIKIQTLAIHIVLTDQIQMLSSKEYAFLEKYYVIKTNHFKKTFLLNIPEEFRRIEREENTISPDTGPDLDKHIFLKALEEIGRVDLMNGENIELKKDDIFLLPYSIIKPLLLNRRIDLI